MNSESVVATDSSRPATDETAALELLQAVLQFARDREYTGYDYADGMSSEFLRVLPIDNKWVNIAVQETIKRAPINLRPLFLVEQRQSFKGSALFALANVSASRLTDSPRYMCEAIRLADWLLDHGNDGYAGYCGGHQHPYQDLDRKKIAGEPSVVSTSYAVRALLTTADETGIVEYGEAAATAPDFLFDDLEYRETNDGAHIRYRPDDHIDAVTLNANALGARMLVDIYARRGGEALLERAQSILDYVVSKQIDASGWMYREPSSASHLSMDSFHNGFIIESLLRYREVTETTRYEPALRDALHFYRRVLFDDGGAPNWDESNAYPRDIHAAAQGIVVFSLLGDRGFASRILDWTVKNLYAGNGRFYYQQRRVYTKQFTLMRWCQAWMAYALARYLEAEPVSNPPSY